jgi:hypothetical protein
MAAGKARNGKEKRDKTAVSQSPFLVLTVNCIGRERSFPDRFGKIFFHWLNTSDL